MAEVLVTNQLFHNPQLLSSVLYDLRAFGNHNNIKDKIAEYSATQEALAVYKVIIKNWEAVMPVILDSKILVWIAYSHYGLAEDDIKRIADLCKEKENLWHQLFFLIEPYMKWNGDRLQFADRRLKSAIIDRYKGDESCIKNTMILYFQNINLPIERQYDELPYLYEDMNRMDDFERHGSSTLDRIEITTGRAETAFAAKRNKFERTTRRTPIHSTAVSRMTAMNHLFDAFENNRASLKGVLDFFVVV